MGGIFSFVGGVPDEKRIRSPAESYQLLQSLIEFLSEGDRLKEEGLFRVQGAEERRIEIQAAIDADAPLNMGEADTLVVAQVLKATIRDSTEPLLIPDSAYEPLIRAASAHADAPETLVREVRAVVDGFSPTYSAACGLVFRFLAQVAEHSKENKMSETNLAVVFAPTALRPPNLDPMVRWWSSRIAFAAHEPRSLLHPYPPPPSSSFSLVPRPR
mmetsp:Transcript_70910/g.198827  ORF Transcript_70910/g.198827 Transcript_70910/m.198827 type:complete len:215 (+) Transcript_70910:259-903(+)